jgi:malate dehydrogenase (oxaloacetate-decarboxylating)(NADP+)
VVMDFNEEALVYHRGKKRAGKIGTEILTSVDGKKDLSLAYTPGVAVPCLEIVKDKDRVYEYTGKGNRVAVVSNGSAVLGLGNIGALAGKPVMEGKALLFKYFGGIDAVDVEIDSEAVDEVVKTVELISPTYGGISLEDIKAPECFEIEARLKKSLGIPVFHDDQHGTAVVVGAGLLNALKIAGKKIEDVKIVINGAGAAGIAIGKILFSLGVGKNNLILCDSKGVVSSKRKGLDKSKVEFAVKTEGKLKDVVDEADVFIGVSKKDLLTPKMLESMAENRIVFALANPDSEIAWDLAHETCGDVIMATGRSDLPNQVNNVLVFPGIFRGALDCRAKKINEEMKVAAVEALVGLVGEPTREGFIVDIFDGRVVVEVAYGAAKAAVESGVAEDGFDLGGYRGRLEGEFLKNE